MTGTATVGATRALAAFVSETNFADLPPRLVEAARVYTLDDLACGFAGSGQPWAGIVGNLVRAGGGVEEASVFTQSRRTTAAQAALVNGVMLGGFECEHVGHHAHPSATVFPATLAMAERERASGREFIAALALGYEVTCRIGEAQTGTVETERGIHNPAANGPFGAAVATGKLLRLDAAIMASAMGIAGSHCGGLIEYAWDGSMTKRLHLGRAAQLGLESALLARAGFTGPATILEGRYGYLNAYSPTPRPDLLTQGLGGEWLMESLAIKAYPCHLTCQAIVAAIQRWKKRAMFEPDAVERIHIRAGRELLQERFLNTAPANMLGAQYSIPYSTAVAVYCDLDDPLNYDEAVLADTGIRRLARAVSWEEAEVRAAGGRAAELELLIGGRQHTLRAADFKGSVADPLTFADAEEKFGRYTRRFLDAGQQAAIIEAVRRLDELTDVSDLAGLIRGR